MRFDLRFTKHALRDLAALDKSIARSVLQKLEAYAKSGHLLRFAKALTGPLKGLYRFRIGRYRVIFERGTEGALSILYVLRVKHRKDIYD